MDSDRFDRLTRAMTDTRSRRGALASLLGGTLGLLAWNSLMDAAAHDVSTACKKKSGKRKRACLKKAKKHNATHTTQAPPPPPQPPCLNGVKDSGESDIDCGGGTCRRCADNKTCSGPNDCDSGTCPTGVCVSCTPGQACGFDSDGACKCTPAADIGLAPTCDKDPVTAGPFISCGSCPEGTHCVQIGTQRYCYTRCGAP